MRARAGERTLCPHGRKSCPDEQESCSRSEGGRVMSAGPEETPAVSVIVPAYRAEKSLEECLASVRAQTFPDFECVVIDDASPDSSGVIAKRVAASDRRGR